MDDVCTREAVAADLPGTRALLVTTWHDTYDRLLGVERVTAITDDWHSIEALTRQLGVAQTSFLVATRGDAIVAHALASAQHAPELVLARLYVRPDHQRRGLGQRLLDAAIARHPDCDHLVLEVQADNAKALAFYLREGFSIVARTSTEGIDHLAMRKPLRAPTSS